MDAAQQANVQYGKVLDAIDEAKNINAAQQDYEKAAAIGRLMIDHHTNDEGQLLAHVHETQGFQEVYDYKGAEKRRWRLERKAEQIHRQMNARTHLFQKVYYAPGLIHDDESRLREAFWSANRTMNYSLQATQAAMFLGAFPLAYRMSGFLRPTSLAVGGILYYLVGYQGVAKPFIASQMQSTLNAHAQPFANKYGIKNEDFE